MSRITKLTFRYITALIFTTTICLNQVVQAQGIPVFNGATLPSPLTAEVIGIQDGDTIELKLIVDDQKAGQRMGKPLRIRFLHINCPERGQPFYRVAKDYTSSRSFHKTVRIRHNGEFDRYGRLLGEVILPDGSNLNKQLVASGLAVHFKKYSSDIEYDRLEKEAKAKKKGMWNQAVGFSRN